MAADALAQMIFSPLFGYICDRLGSIRFVSLTCSVIFALGNLCYSFVALVPKSVGILVQARLYAIFIARFLVGIGTGKFDYNAINILHIYLDFSFYSIQFILFYSTLVSSVLFYSSLF